MFNFDNNKNGFTLVEILIVIAIIGVLSGIMLIALNDRRATARDAKRIQEVKQLQRGLELFYQKHNAYPCGLANSGDAPPYTNTTADFSLTAPFLDGGTPSNCIGIPTTGLYTEGILPINNLEDPINTAPYLYAYRVSSDRQIYVLYAHLEDNSDLMQSDGGFCNNYYEASNDPGTLTPYILSSGPGSMITCN